MAKWYDTSKRGFLLDFQIPDSFDQVPLGQLSTLRNIATECIVAQLKDAGVTALYTHARDYAGNCYYDTRVGHKHTSIGRSALLREFSAACRQRRHGDPLLRLHGPGARGAWRLLPRTRLRRRR